MVKVTGSGLRPTHPGELLREEIMPAAKLTQVSLAEALRVSRKTISEIVLEQRPVTTDIAIRLGRFFGNGPELWINMQNAVNVWDALHERKADYEKIRPLARTPDAEAFAPVLANVKLRTPTASSSGTTSEPSNTTRLNVSRELLAGAKKPTRKTFHR